MARLTLIATLAFALSMGGAAFAHSPEGWLGFAFQWPAGLEPNVDGDGSEYSIIPDNYWQDTSEMPDTQGGVDINLADFAAKATVTYSLGTNRFYLYSEVFDDINDQDDTWQIVVDADHSGGQFAAFPDVSQEESDRLLGQQAQQYEIWNTKGGSAEHGPDEVHFIWAKATWLPEAGWYVARHKFEGEVGGQGTTFLEVLLTPLNDLNWAGPNESTLHTLIEQETVGLGYNWMDYEDPTTESRGGWESFWNLTQSNNMYYHADFQNDFLLAPVDGSVSFPTAVEATTWGRIKTRFAE